MEGRTDKHEFLGTFRLIKSGFLKETALMQFLPLQNIVPTMVIMEKEKNKGQARLPEISKFFIPIKLLGTSPQTLPLCARG